MAITEPMKLLATLRRVPIFRGLSKSTLLDVARRTGQETYPSGATVVREGEPGDTLCIIVDGTVEVRTGGRVVAQMTTGDFFGEISLFDGEPRSATVVAVEDVALLTLASPDFEELLKIHYVARNALESLAQRVREAHNSHKP
jgi:CRP/FNR family cyclic AMP-dependent transcriptional regulator